VAVLPDGRVVSGSDDKSLRVWDTASGACERVLEGHTGSVLSVAVLPDGRVVSGSFDNTPRVWDAASGACERVVKHTDADYALLDPSGREGHTLSASAAGLRHDGALLVTSSARIHAGEPLKTVNAGDTSSGVLVIGAATESRTVFILALVAPRLAR
jgi:WD40 repeat protein